MITIVELIIRGSEFTPLDPIDDTSRKDLIAPFSGFAISCHVCVMPDVVHISSSRSPSLQTGATTEEEISTTPEIDIIKVLLSHQPDVPIAESIQADVKRTNNTVPQACLGFIIITVWYNRRMWLGLSKAIISYNSYN